jgi:crossover junction endodeoxyribonuclease RuvC
VIVVGVDPGTRRLGWGVVSREGSRLSCLAHGVIALDAAKPLATRLEQIDRELAVILERHRPEHGSVESLFFHRDAQAAAKLGHARGVALCGLARAGIPVFEYSPARVKRTLTGRGQAEKHQVALMVRAILGLGAVPSSDAADALAVAVTHLRLISFARAVEGQTGRSLASFHPPRATRRRPPRGAVFR